MFSRRCETMRRIYDNRTTNGFECREDATRRLTNELSVGEPLLPLAAFGKIEFDAVGILEEGKPHGRIRNDVADKRDAMLR